MFLKEKKVWEMITTYVKEKFEDYDFVQCEASKLWGRKRDMTVRHVRSNEYGFMGIFQVDKEVYFSPIFAPKWDLKDITEEKPKYYKIEKSEENHIEIHEDGSAKPIKK